MNFADYHDNDDDSDQGVQEVSSSDDYVNMHFASMFLRTKGDMYKAC